MNVVDIISIIIIILGAIVGFKKGAIKSFIHLVGLVSIVVVAYQFKGYLANVMIRYLPFFNFGGALKDLYAVNILIYEAIAFAVIFILLYCILNILINLSGILDLLIKLTIILELPSKIIGAILGAIEAMIFVFVAAFIMLQFGPTQKYIMDSNFTLKIVERTPVVRDVFIKTILASEDVYKVINESANKENKLEANLNIVRILMRYGIVSADDVNLAISSGKLHMDNVVVATGG